MNVDRTYKFNNYSKHISRMRLQDEIKAIKHVKNGNEFLFQIFFFLSQKKYISLFLNSLLLYYSDISIEFSFNRRAVYRYNLKAFYLVLSIKTASHHKILLNMQCKPSSSFILIPMKLLLQKYVQVYLERNVLKRPKHTLKY